MRVAECTGISGRILTEWVAECYRNWWPDGSGIPRLAVSVHHLIYLLLFAIMISGYLISTADGRPVSFFGWFEIPALVSGISGQEDIAGEVHFYLAWALVILASLHGLAAIKHHLINRDRTLTRMLKPR